jgi:hypothetical protein
MSMDGSVASFLLKKAWEQLWKPGTPYYLPTVFMDGASGGGKTVPALGSRPVPDLGPFGLFGDSTFGEVNLSLNGASIGGLNTASNGGFTYTDATQVFTAQINFAGLTYNGNYAVTGNGVLGCALAGASGLMHILPGAKAEADSALAGSDDDTRLQLARQYRDNLVKSPAGLEMVGTYYDNNWAMNEVVRGNNLFTNYMNQNRPVSSSMADQTKVAAQSPDDPTKTVGDNSYYFNSMLRQGAFMRACQLLDPSGTGPYGEAADATFQFKGAVIDNYSGPVTVSTVMNNVQQAPTGSLRKFAATANEDEETVGGIAVSRFRTPEALELFRKAHAEIEAFEAEYMSKGGRNQTFTELLAAGDMPIGSGSFNDTFAAPNFKITGTVVISGPPENPQLVVTVTKLEANVPSINVSLSQSSPWPQPSLYDKVVQALANAGFVHDLIRSKLNDKLSDPSVMSYLTNRINDSINDALGNL